MNNLFLSKFDKSIQPETDRVYREAEETHERLKGVSLPTPPGFKDDRAFVKWFDRVILGK